jgi:hypothetical protein
MDKFSIHMDQDNWSASEVNQHNTFDLDVFGKISNGNYVPILREAQRLKNVFTSHLEDFSIKKGTEVVYSCKRV